MLACADYTWVGDWPLWSCHALGQRDCEPSLVLREPQHARSSAQPRSDSKMPPALRDETTFASHLGFLRREFISEVAFALARTGGLEGEGRRGSRVCHCPPLCRALGRGTLADMPVPFTEPTGACAAEDRLFIVVDALGSDSQPPRSLRPL